MFSERRVIVEMLRYVIVETMRRPPTKDQPREDIFNRLLTMCADGLMP